MNAPTPGLHVDGHTLFEDAQAIFTGAMFVSLALILFAQVGLMTGGTAGAAFVLHYATGISLGKLFFAADAVLIVRPFVPCTPPRVGRRSAPELFMRGGESRTREATDHQMRMEESHAAAKTACAV